ncbi:MAG TPA: Na/Pi cotransporter family protein [Candidatus Faecimorpha stercoravium]|nr:Na/Pi cotransporter family protein [Candidatus Faecimorpha stercoravium]
MDIFAVFTWIGGLALFLYGMNLLGKGLETLSGSKLQGILERRTSNPVIGVLLGAVVTAILQSSSTTTVMVVGFVNSGIMQLSQTVGVIMGANIGTTATPWILSLTGIQGDNLWMRFLNPSTYAPLLAMAGVILLFRSNARQKDSRKKDLGMVLIGFAILMIGMQIMSAMVQPLAASDTFARLMQLFSNPILGIGIGCIVTAIIQSSSVTIGILQTLSTTGQITYGIAIPLILGQNIGTCISALFAGIGANRNARRAAMIHLYFNVIGALFFLTLFYVLRSFVSVVFMDMTVGMMGIAGIHTLFNCLTTLVLLPISKCLVRLAEKTVRVDSHEKTKKNSAELKDTVLVLDERFFAAPTIAIERAKEASWDMAKICQRAFSAAIGQVMDFQTQESDQIRKMEKRTDIYEDRLGTYLVRLSSMNPTLQGSREISKILHCISDFERIADHSVRILETAEEIQEKKVSFSVEASGELKIVESAVSEIVDMSISAFIQNDLPLASKVEPLEEVIDNLCSQLRDRHVERLKNGECTIEQGFIFVDLLTNYERVADHCSNIGGCIIQSEEDSYRLHEYLSQVKESNGNFVRYYEQFKVKYSLN